MQKLVWDAILTEKKLRYNQRHQYAFNRKLDEQNYGQQSKDITIHIITPYADRYSELREDATCILNTGSQQEVLVRLPDHSTLVYELTELVKTDQYLIRKNNGSLTKSIQSIIASRAKQNCYFKRIDILRGCICLR